MRNNYQWIIAAVLAALLVGATWFCISVWRSTPAMPVYGNIILAGAAVLMLVSGCGLIALMFYSRRKGYDEPARSNRSAQE